MSNGQAQSPWGWLSKDAQRTLSDPGQGTATDPWSWLSKKPGAEPRQLDPVARTAIGLGKILGHTVSQMGSALWFAATHPIPKEGHGDTPQAVAESTRRTLVDMQAMPSEKMRDIQEGTAFMMSFGTGGAVEAIPKLGPALGKWGSFAVNEFLGGGLYGSMRPLDEDESRASAIFGDAAQFAAAGLLFKTAGEASGWLKKRIWRL